MKKIASYGCLLILGLAASLSAVHAQTAAPAAPAAAAPAAPATPPPATLDQRVADLEAYVNNGLPGATSDGKTTWTSNLTGPGPGHNAWLLTSTAFVLMMTLPGLALFYGGMVRRKNVLSVMAQCFGITGLVTILWWLVGYSFAFGHGDGNGSTAGTSLWGSILGTPSKALFAGVSSTPNTDYGDWVSENVYAMFQLMFAIITPALIVGAIAERVKFVSLILFITGWMFVVYFPLAHMVWGADGLADGVWNSAAKIHALDFAGGTVVHMSSGYSALIFALILGKRLGFGTTNFSPHSVVLVLIGTGLLWVGWYGFNAGSAVAADVIAANAFTTTTLATAIGSFVWALWEFILRKKATVMGFCSGAVAGLVVITPACGYVNPTGGVYIGIAAGTIPFFAVTYLKPLFGYDDALDTFGVHAIGGTVGAIMTGILADPSINSNLTTNLKPFIDAHTLWIEQVKAVGLTIGLSVVGTAILAFALKFTIGLRPTAEQETQGLDIAEHGEEGYIL